MIQVTREVSFAPGVSNRVAYVHGSEIEEIGRPRQVLQNPESERRRNVSERGKMSHSEQRGGR